MFTRYPLLWPLMGICAGILLAAYMPAISMQVTFLVPILLILALSMLLLAPKLRYAVSFMVIFFVIGFILTALQDDRLSDSHYSKLNNKEKARYCGTLVSYPVITKKAIRFEIELDAVDDRSISGLVYLYVPQDSALLGALPGDRLLFQAKLNAIAPPANPHEFDYQNYLHLHQVYAQTYTQDYKLITAENYSLWRYSTRARNALISVIQSMNLTDEETAVASALLVGYRHFISDETTQAFSGAGAMHVLAVSGLHVGILYLVTAFLLGIDKNRPDRANWKQVLGTILIIWTYALLTGLSPSVTRAAVMFTFIAGSYLLKRKSPSIQAILTSAIFLLALKPNYLFEVGFQLSYAAVFGIIYLQPRFYRLLPKPRFKLADLAWQITAVSLAAQAATFPFGLYYFHQFPLLFILSNLLVIPIATMAMYYGLFLLLIFTFIEPISLLVYPLKGFLWLMINGVKAVQSIPHAVLDGLWISRLELVLLLITVFALADLFFKKRKWALFTGLASCAALLITMGIRNFENQQTEKLTVYSIKSAVAIEAKTGTKSVLVASSHLLKDRDAMLFHIRHNQWALGTREVELLPLEKDTAGLHFFNQDGLLELHGRRILIYDEAPDSLKMPLNPEVLLITGKVIPPKQPITAHIILHNNLKNSTREAWLEKYPDAHDLQHGAYEMNFD